MSFLIDKLVDDLLVMNKKYLSLKMLRFQIVGYMKEKSIEPISNRVRG